MSYGSVPQPQPPRPRDHDTDDTVEIDLGVPLDDHSSHRSAPQLTPYDRYGGNNGGYGGNQQSRPPPAQFGQGPRPGGGGGRGGPTMGRDDYGSSQNVEMASLTQNGANFAQNGPLSPVGADPNFILNECRSIDDGVSQIENNLNQLRMLQDRSLNEADGGAGGQSQTQRQLDSLSAETMAMYRELTDRVRRVKSRPEAGQARNAPQVNRVDRRLKAAITGYQQIESGFRQKSRDQLERQYRYVRPDADEAEVRSAVEDAASGGGQIFQQALMQSDRRGQARAVLSAVQDRHEQMKKIEQQMIELAQLFQDMDTLIVQQEVQVAQIEQKGEEIVENLDKGNEEIVVAVETAKKTRKKKWICLAIVVAIVVIIAVIVTVYFLIIRPPQVVTTTPAPAAPTTTAAASTSSTTARRSLEIRGVDFLGERPIAQVYAQSKIVVPGAEYDATADANAIPLSHFAGKAPTLIRRFVVTDPAHRPAADPNGPLGHSATVALEGGDFKVNSFAAGARRAKRLVLPGGRSFDPDTEALLARARTLQQ